MQKQVSQEVPATGCAKIITAHNGMVTPGRREEEGPGSFWEGLTNRMEVMNDCVDLNKEYPI